MPIGITGFTHKNVRDQAAVAVTCIENGVPNSDLEKERLTTTGIGAWTCGEHGVWHFKVFSAAAWAAKAMAMASVSAF